MNEKAVLNGGTIWAESGTGSQNTFAGPISVNSAGGIFDAGGNLVGGTAVKPTAVLNLTGPISGAGGVTKNGPGTVFITAAPSYAGSTTINDGTLQINTHSAVTLHAITGAGTLVVDNTTALTATSIKIGVLTVGAGSIVTIAPLAGGPLAGNQQYPVPEPATLLMLLTACLTGLSFGVRRF